jgi:heparan-alpha-glucosaminide N-acetyltransferase
MHTTLLEKPTVSRSSTPDAVAGPSGRIGSIDLLRGVTILLMIFVNDIAGVARVPGWLLHFEPFDADGMTFVDVIFPAFLFIVGMSIPFSLRRRLSSGEPMREIWRHVAKRTIALLVIGVFMVNSGSLSEQAILSHPTWSLLMYAGVLLVWSRWPRELAWSKTTERGLMALGVALLAAMAVLFRGPGEPGVVELRPQWWGILGQIGWAYLVGCTAYLLFRSNVVALVGATVILYGVFIADSAGAFAGLTWITSWLSIGPLIGTHGAITVSGLVLGVLLLPDSTVYAPYARMRWAGMYAFMLGATGWLLHSAAGVHEMFIVNKILATPPWGLYSAAITVLVWVAIYWILDVRHARRGAETLVLAGQNALLAYILAPIIYALFGLVADSLEVTNVYWSLGSQLSAGLLRGVVLAVVICVISAALTRRGYSLRV